MDQPVFIIAEIYRQGGLMIKTFLFNKIFSSPVEVFFVDIHPAQNQIRNNIFVLNRNKYLPVSNKHNYFLALH